jgi:putative serine protease PepD
VILRDLRVVVIAAVTSIAVTLLVHPGAVGDQLLARSSELGRSAANLPASWVEQVAAKVLPSIVTLQISEGDRAELGSGVILTADGLIMTNNHVVAALGTGPHASARTVVTLNDGRRAAFDVIAADPQSDIAVVRAQQISGLTPISFGSSADLRIGQPVAAVGSPLGLQGTSSPGLSAR